MPSPVAAQAQQYIVQPVAEMKVKQLPKGELFWRVESVSRRWRLSETAAPPYRWNPDTVSYDGLPSLTAEVAGKAWTSLRSEGPGNRRRNEGRGDRPRSSAQRAEYLLRANYGHGSPGATTPVHMLCTAHVCF